MKEKYERIKKRVKKILKRIKEEMTDKYTIIIFLIVITLLSSEVWLFYLLGFIFDSPTLLGVATACWAFWLGPFTPFLSLSFLITVGIREGIRKFFGK